MDVQTRNTKVMEFENLVHWTINKNRPLIRALNLDENDVFQDLMIAAIIAVDRFDSDRSDSLFTHVREKLQYEILNIKGKYRTAGMTGSQGIFVSSVDAYYYNGDPLDIPSDEGGYGVAEVMDLLDTLAPEEQEAVRKKLIGEPIRRKQQKADLVVAQDKIRSMMEGRQLACC